MDYKKLAGILDEINGIMATMIEPIDFSDDFRVEEDCLGNILIANDFIEFSAN